MDSEIPQVQAIIVTWNKKSDVLKLLAQLEHIDYPAQRLSVLVVDNNSTDGTAPAIEAAFPNVTLIKHPENRGGAGGFNSGMRWTLANRPEAQYLWLLDNDVVVDENTLKALVRVLETHAHAAICGSKIMNADQRDEMIEIGAFIDYRTGQIKSNKPNPRAGGSPAAVFKVDYVAACSLLARAAHVMDMGVWRDDLFIYWDDMEWGARFNAAGYDVLAASASTVYHPSWAGRTADHSAVWRNYYRVRNSLWFFNNYADGLKRRFLLARIILRFMMHAANTGINSHMATSRAFVDGMVDFFRGSYGKRAFAPAVTDLEKFIRSAQTPVLPVFVPDAETSDNALAFIRRLLSHSIGINVAAIVPAAIKHDWEQVCGAARVMAYKRTWRGRIKLSERFDIMRFLKKNGPWQLMISSPRTSKMTSIWGRYVARVNFDSGAIVAIERLSVTDLFRIFLHTPVFLLKALFSPPKKDIQYLRKSVERCHVGAGVSNET